MSETVLVVDDNANLRELLRISLETLGHMQVVGEAGNGREGVEKARALQPRIVLLDLSMPTMDGLEALGAIRQASPQSRVIVLTGFKADRLKDLALELGANAFLEKGIPPTQLADAVRLAAAHPPPPYQRLSAERARELEERVRQLI